MNPAPRGRAGLVLSILVAACGWALGVGMPLASETPAASTGTRVLMVRTSGVAADLVCPRRSPARPAAAAPTQEPPLAAPDPDELAEILAAANAPAPSGRGALPPRSGERIPRIGLWGDSHLAAHFFTEELIRLSGLPRGRVQPSLIPPTVGRAGVRLPLRRSCVGPGWRWRSAHQLRDPTGSIGLGLAQMSASGVDSHLWLDFRLGEETVALKELVIRLSPQAGPLTLELSVDDEPAQRVSLDPATEPNLRIVGEPGLSTLRLRPVEGELVLDGFLPTYRQEAALILDTFAFPGATARGWTRVDPASLASTPGVPGHDLVVIAYGTNEGADRNFEAGAYAAMLREAVSALRVAAPQAQCLLIGPTDRGVLVRRPSRKAARRKSGAPAADLLHYARVHRRIAEIQTAVAAEQGCLFWDWQAAMGGPGGAYRWHYRSPRLMSPDLIHLSVPGYQHSARLFHEQLRLSEWLPGSVPR